MQKEIYLTKDVSQITQKVCRDLLATSNFKNFLTNKVEGSSLNANHQFLFGWKPAEKHEAVIWQIIARFMLESEKFFPNSSLKFLSSLEERFIANKAIDIESSVEFISTRSSRSDLRNCIHEYMANDPVLSRLTLDAIELAGYGGKILVEKSTSNNDSVELIKGYTFDLSPMWKVSCKLLEPRIVIIDGYVESVSEIHHLLSKFFESKDTGILIFRGCSTEVLSTLRVNWERGIIKVLPVVVPFDLDGINLLNDFAVIAGCDVVSSNKGNLISSIDYENLPRLEEVDFQGEKICIRNSRTYSFVLRHVSFLKDKQRESGCALDVSSLYNKRIRALTPNHVVVRLREDLSFVKRAQALDLVLRDVKSLVDYGTINNNAQQMNVFVERCYQTISNCGAVILCHS